MPRLKKITKKKCKMFMEKIIKLFNDTDLNKQRSMLCS